MKYLLIILLLSPAVQRHRQNLYKKDNILIYEKLLSIYNGKQFKIQPDLSLITLKRFDFKNPTNNELKENTLLSAGWKLFLTSIDTSSLKAGIMDKNILKKYSKKKRSQDRTITFSPIIFSANRMKAVCAIKEYESPEDASEQVYLLEKKDSKWVVIKFYIISIS
jgi:hypothetical protein